MENVFADFDVAGFWDPSDLATSEYVGRPLDAATVQSVEDALGYTLPASYVALMRVQNGGIPRYLNHRTETRTSWPSSAIAITGMLSVGSDAPMSLCGEFGSEFWIEAWEYPPIGIYFADCPSAGHDMLCLDYSECGPQGEPRVVHVDQESDFKVVVVAPTFESFVRGLEGEEAFEPDA